MRPRTIVYFESLFLGTLALGVVQSFLARNAATAFGLGIQVTTFAIMIGLTLLISRGRSRIAMWISIGGFVLGLPGFIWLLSNGFVFGSILISLVQVVGQAAAFAMLFTPSARAWLSRREASA